MGKKEIRLLRADEIECRIGMIKENGLSLLLYKDARADMKILDETFGLMGWKRRHEMIGGSLYCTVSVWDAEKAQWIDKSDVGTESNSEKEKGQASDSFKRACVSVGIGRELYSAPFVWIGSETVSILSNNGKCFTKEKFKVRDISYNNEREINGLLIAKEDGTTVYAFGSLKNQIRSQTSSNAANNSATEDDRSFVIRRELERTGVALDAVLKRYGVNSVSEMSANDYRNAVNSLRKTKDKAA